jgi:hypothetical protein
MRAVVAAVAAITATAILPVSAADARAGSVSLSKVQYDSPGADTGSNPSLNKEWVTVTNHGSRATTLTGWTVRDPEGHVYTFPELKLKAGKSVTVHTGAGTDSATHLYWDNGAYVWNNSGDKAILKDGDKKNVDSCKWGDGSGSIAC